MDAEKEPSPRKDGQKKAIDARSTKSPNGTSNLRISNTGGVLLTMRMTETTIGGMIAGKTESINGGMSAKMTKSPNGGMNAKMTKSPHGGMNARTIRSTRWDESDEDKKPTWWDDDKKTGIVKETATKRTI